MEKHGFLNRYSQEDLKWNLENGIELLATATGTQFKICDRGNLENTDLCLRQVMPDGSLGPPTMEALHLAGPSLSIEAAEFDPIDEPYGVVTHTQEELQGWVDRDVRTIRTADKRTYSINRNLEDGQPWLMEIRPDGSIGLPTRTTAVIMSVQTGPDLIEETMPTEEEAEALAKAHDRECTTLDPTTERLSDRVNAQAVQRMRERKLLAKCRQQLAGVENRVTELTGMTNQDMQKIKRLEQSSKTLAERVVSQDAELINLRDELDRAEQEARQARTQRDEHAKEELRISEKQKDILAALSAARENRNMAVGRANDLGVEINEKCNQLVQALKDRDMFHAGQERTAREMNALQRNYAELKKTEDGLSERLALTSKDLAMWRERARSAESAVTDLDVETVRLKRELRELREERDKAQWEWKRMQDALDLQTKRVGELETNPMTEAEAMLRAVMDKTLELMGDAEERIEKGWIALGTARRVLSMGKK